MSLVTIKPANYQKLLNLLTNTLNFITPDGRSIKGMSNIVLFDHHLLIIDSLVSIHGYEELDPQKTQIVKRAIFRFSRYRIRTTPYFKKAIDAEVRMIGGKRKRQFHTIFPTLVDSISLCGTQHFSLFENKIEVKNLSQIKQKFEIDNAIRESSVQLSARTRSLLQARLNNITYLTLARTASSPAQAFDSARKVMDLFRGIMSFSLGRNTYHFQAGAPQPLAFVSPFPCYYVFNHNGTFEDYWFGWPLPTALHVRRLNRQQVQDITRFIELFEQGLQRGNLTRKVLEPMLRLYGLALDQPDRDSTFLYLWQILELVALGHIEGLPDSEKKKRIKALLRSDLQRGVFECLYKRRNLLVHKGRFNVRLEDEINALKSLCDYSICFLFENINKLNDWRALKYYLQNVILDETEINRKMGVLREIVAN